MGGAWIAPVDNLKPSFVTGGGARKLGSEVER